MIDILAIGEYENGISSCNFVQIELVHTDNICFYWSYHGMRHVDPRRTDYGRFRVCLPAILGFDGCIMGISGTYKKLIMNT